MDKPNILFISTDQHSYHAISAFGNKYVKTPNIDRLAKNGISFERNYSSNPVCGPARTTWATGLHGSENGVPINEGSLHDHIPDIGMILNKNGYYAAHSGKWHVAGRDVRKGFHTLYFGQRDILAGGAEFYDCATSHAAINFLIEYDDEKPFYLQANFINPHDICEYLHSYEYKDIPDLVKLNIIPEDQLPPLPDNFNYDKRETVTQYVCRRQKNCMIHDKIHAATEKWTDIQWRYFIWHYYRFIEKVDMEIGNLINALEKSKFKNNTIIIFTADHGESLARHKMFQKFTSYDESLRVPFIAASLGDNFGIPKGTINHNSITGGIDVFRTICDYAGIEVPEYAHGISLKPLIEGKSVKGNRSIYGENNYYERYIVMKDYKYIVDYIPNENDFFTPPNANRNKFGSEELFDLKNDPLETKNIAFEEENKGIIAEARKELIWHENRLNQLPITNDITKAMLEKWSKAILLEWKVRNEKGAYHQNK